MVGWWVVVVGVGGSFLNFCFVMPWHQWELEKTSGINTD